MGSAQGGEAVRPPVATRLPCAPVPAHNAPPALTSPQVPEHSARGSLSSPIPNPVHSARATCSPSRPSQALRPPVHSHPRPAHRVPGS